MLSFWRGESTSRIEANEPFSIFMDRVSSFEMFFYSDTIWLPVGMLMILGVDST